MNEIDLCCEFVVSIQEQLRTKERGRDGSYSLPCRSMDDEEWTPSPPVASLLEKIMRLVVSTQEGIVSLQEGGDTEADAYARIAHLKTNLRDLHVLVESLRHVGEEEDRDADREEVIHRAEHYQREHTSLSSSLRKATLTYRSCFLRRQEEERKALFEGSSSDTTTEGGLRRRRVPGSQDRPFLSLVSKAQDSTEGLRRTRQSLAESVECSIATMKVLEKSSTTLHTVFEEHRAYDATMQTGKQLLGKLRQRDLTDKLLILMGFVVFLLVALYVAKKRLHSLLGYVWGSQ